MKIRRVRYLNKLRSLIFPMHGDLYRNLTSLFLYIEDKWYKFSYYHPGEREILFKKEIDDKRIKEWIELRYVY